MVGGVGGRCYYYTILRGATRLNYVLFLVEWCKYQDFFLCCKQYKHVSVKQGGFLGMGSQPDSVFSLAAVVVCRAFFKSSKKTSFFSVYIYLVVYYGIKNVF